MTHGERINIERERERKIRGEQEKQKTVWGEAGQCQEEREDRTVTFTYIPPNVKIWSWNLWSGREGRRAGRLSGPQWSQLKQCQPVGEGGYSLGGWQGRGGTWCQVGQDVLLEIPALSRSQPRSQVSFVLWQRWNKGLLRGHKGNTPTALSAGKEAKKKGNERGWGGRSRRKRESIKKWNWRVEKGFGWWVVLWRKEDEKKKEPDDLNESTDGKKLG